MICLRERESACAQAEVISSPPDTPAKPLSQDEARIHVQSEDEPERTLLETKISKDDGYQKQQDTLIVWTEANVTDMALSFQEAEGCAVIWEFISDAQQKLGGVVGAGNPHFIDPQLYEDFEEGEIYDPDGIDGVPFDYYELYGVDLPSIDLDPEEFLGIYPKLIFPDKDASTNTTILDDVLSDDVADPHSIMLPTPDLANLTEIESAIRLASNGASRDALARFIIQTDYVTKLVPLVEIAEDLENLPDLHKLCAIMKTLILLNDHTILDQVVTDELFMGVVGALEYDPDYPTQKANHRQYLSTASRFREVVKIDDAEVQRKIHYTYRLQYLKDVVLARILDDGTFTALNSLIYFHQLAILQYVQGSGPFLKELFGLFSTTGTDIQKKKDALHFVQQCCNVAKSLQNPARVALYQSFIPAGLLNVIAFALLQQDPAMRVAGTEILGALLEHDATLLRGQISRALSEDKSKPMTDVLIELLLVETDLGVQSQLADAIKHLLDPMPAPQQGFDPSGRNMEFLAKLRNQTDNILNKYYEEATRRLFKPLKDLEGRKNIDDLSVAESMLFSHLLDILSVLVKQYNLRSRVFLLSDPLAPQVAQLLASSEKHLKLSALKYFRSCIGLHENFYNRQIIQHNLFDPILNVLFESMPRDNLLNSACLELFEFIKRENFKELTIHLVETYRERLEQIPDVNTFRDLIDKYEKFTAALPDNLSFTSVETEQTPMSRQSINGARWQGLTDADNDEQSFFNGAEHDVDEDDSQLVGVMKPMPNGASPLKPLVDYPADEDEEMDILAEDASPARPLPSSENAAPEVVRQETPTPPERVVGEKKRGREEDEEEDELAKMGATPSKKRSASTSSTKEEAKEGEAVRSESPRSSATPPSPNGGNPAPTRVLRRKHSINRDGGSGGGKRASQALAVKSSGDATTSSPHE